MGYLAAGLAPNYVNKRKYIIIIGWMANGWVCVCESAVWFTVKVFAKSPLESAEENYGTYTQSKDWNEGYHAQKPTIHFKLVHDQFW